MIVVGFTGGGEIYTICMCFIARDDIEGGIGFRWRATLVANYAAEHPR